MTKYKQQIRRATLLEVAEMAKIAKYAYKKSGFELPAQAMFVFESEIMRMAYEIKQDVKDNKYNGSFSPHGDMEYLV